MAEAREGMYACVRVCVRCDEVQQAKLVPSCTGIVHVVCSTLACRPAVTM